MLKRVQLLFVAFFLSILTILNFKMPMIGEDFALSLTYVQHGDSFFQKVGLIVSKIVYQSLHWNARLGEQLAIVVLAFDKSLFNIINIVFTCLFFYLVLVYAKGDLPQLTLANATWLIVPFSIFLLLPQSGDLLLWISMVTNYLWSLLFLAIAFLPYRLWYSNRDWLTGKPLFMKILFIVIAVLGGMSNENSVVALVVAAVVMFFLARKKIIQTTDTPKWYWINLIAMLAGYAYLLFSPSTQVRLAYYQTVFGVQTFGILASFHKLANIFTQYYYTTKVILLTTLFIGLLYFGLLLWGRMPLNAAKRNNLVVIFSLLVLSYLSLGALLFSPYVENRSFFLNWFFLLVIILAFILEITSFRQVFLLLTLPILVVGMVYSVSLYRCTDTLNEAAQLRNYTILSQMANGKRDINVPAFTDVCPAFFTNRDDWIRSFLHDEIYYGVDHINLFVP